MPPGRLRKPDAAYNDKNGFRESGGAAVDDKAPDDITIRNVRLAQYMLATKGSFVPSRETLRRLGESKTQPADTVETVTVKIEQLKEQHARDVEDLLRFQLSEYHQELSDHRSSHDESAYMEIDEAYPDRVEFKHALEALDRGVHQMDRFKRDMDDALSMLRYTHLVRLTRLIKRRNELKSQDVAARQKRDAWFPQTPQQYHHITERDHQLRVARFLTGSSTEQEKMKDEFNWASRAVQPLLSAYQTNLAFKDEVNSAVSGPIVADPRRRSYLRQTEEEPVFARFSPLS